MTTDSFIHVFKPGSARTLLLLHGTGGDESDLLQLGASIDPNAAILSPRGQVLENDMARFFRRFAPGVLDFQDLSARTQELADFVRDAAAQYGFDPKRVTAVGYSNGANIAASVLLHRPETLAAAVLLRPMEIPAPSPLPALAGKPVLVLLGLHDQVTPPTSGKALIEVMEQAGALMESHTWDTDHRLTPKDVEAVKSWLERVHP